MTDDRATRLYLKLVGVLQDEGVMVTDETKETLETLAEVIDEHEPEPEAEEEAEGDDVCDICMTSKVTSTRVTYCGKTIGVECGCDDENDDGACNDTTCERCREALAKDAALNDGEKVNYHDGKPLRSYHIDVGNSTIGPVGLCAVVVATSRQDALDLLNEVMLEEIAQDVMDDDACDSDETERGVRYINCYTNMKAFTVHDVRHDDGPEETETFEDTRVHKFLNKYVCECGHNWIDLWDSACNDRCPKCNKEIEPTSSEDVYA